MWFDTLVIFCDTQFEKHWVRTVFPKLFQLADQKSMKNFYADHKISKNNNADHKKKKSVNKYIIRLLFGHPNTVKPVLTVTSEQRPPVNNDRPEYLALLNLL
jgi:hypothetical protein